MPSAGSDCPTTPFETIPPNDVVGWDQPTWQRAADGVWGHPYLDSYTPDAVISESETRLKILWWVLDGGDAPLVLTVTSVVGGSFQTSYSFDAPGRNRRDRPTDIPIPAPGCYSIGVTIGTRSGSIVDRVAP
jgi:hypothetical protein